MEVPCKEPSNHIIPRFENHYIPQKPQELQQQPYALHTAQNGQDI